MRELRQTSIQWIYWVLGSGHDTDNPVGASTRALEVSGSRRLFSLIAQTALTTTALARLFAIGSGACSVRTSAAYCWRRPSYTAVRCLPHPQGAATNNRQHDDSPA